MINNKKSIKSYVSRRGRMTSCQSNALSHIADYAIDFKSDFNTKKNIILEIGFGMGDSLFQQAKAEPDCLFIGVEVYPSGVGHFLHQVKTHQLDNVRVFHGDVMDIVQQIPADSLSKVQIFFPDPWHKHKHKKRRLIKKELVDILNQKMVPGAILFIVTDWSDYANSIYKVLKDNSSLRYLGSTKPKRFTTKYETRALRLGHTIYEFISLTAKGLDCK